MHIEAVTNLSTQGFLLAFKRFISRRGPCSELLSDNGTNFKGTDIELRQIFKTASSFYKEVSEILAKDSTNWSFVPPASPHFGGLWEAGVKSVKYHLRRVISEHKLTYEELSTVLCQILACCILLVMTLQLYCH